MSYTPSALLPYGWGAHKNDPLPPGGQPARIIRHDGRTLLGVTASGPCVLLPSERLEPQPTVGDWVAIPADSPDSDRRAILEVLPRRSLLRRQSADGLGEQALAANVDLVLITCGIDRPIRAGRIQRVAAQAWDCGATPVLVLTKAAEIDAMDLPRIELEHPGMQVLATAALEGVGLDEVSALIAGRTAVLIGESGAGKSTLANALLGEDIALTRDVRAGDRKGRHTTTSRQLHRVPGELGGVIIDTPGIRSVGLAADAVAVGAVFSDIQQWAVDCRFSDCGHDTEPGCAVKDAIAGGRVSQERYEGWRRLQREVANAELRATPHEFRAEARKFGRRVKEVKALKGR